VVKEQSNLDKLRELLDTLRGKKDVKTRLAVLTNPENLDTMSVLSKEQAHFLGETNWLVNQSWGKMFMPMNELAQSWREPNISINGRGREDSIEFMRAINEAKVLSKLEGKKGESKD
jgi:hypothetical protein